MNFKNAILAGAAMVAAASAATPASAITFNLIENGNGVGQGTQARLGFEVAAAYWSSVLTNDITVNLQIGFNPLGEGILGSTGSGVTTLYTRSFYDALQANRTSALDNIAVANLRPLTAGSGATGGTGAITYLGNALNATNNGYIDTATRLDNDGGANNRGLTVNTSVAKALGITSSYTGAPISPTAIDGSVTFSTLFDFDFNPYDGIDANAFDFVGVAIHEIGHALGFRSGVDRIDGWTAPGTTAVAPVNPENYINIFTQLDLFRYGSEGLLNWSTQGTPYFSIDGGATQMFGDSLMSTGRLNGDGRQASHFKDSAAGDPQLGILDPTSGRGQLQEVTALDLAAFDAFGWQVSFDVLQASGYRLTTAQIFASVTGVPEPTSWMTMIGGFAFIGGAMRRRQAALRTVAA